MRNLAILIILPMLMLPVTGTAQDGRRLNYGNTVEGSLSADQREETFTFEGSADDVIYVYLDTDDATLRDPDIALLNNEGGFVADTTDSFQFGREELAYELREPGTYTLVVSANDDESGVYALTLRRLSRLSPGEQFGGSISRDVPPATYYIKFDRFFGVYYEQTAGDLSAEISLNTLDDGVLDEIAVLSGESLEAGVIGVTGEPSAVYILKVRADPLNSSFQAQDAGFVVRLTNPQ